MGVGERQVNAEGLVGALQHFDGFLHALVIARFAAVARRTVEERVVVGIAHWPWIWRRLAPARHETGHTGNETFGSQSVVLPEPVDVVPILLQVPKQVWLILMEEVIEAAMAAHVYRPTREKTAPRRTADRVLHVALCKPHALRGQPVHVGSAREPMPVTADAA